MLVKGRRIWIIWLKMSRGSLTNPFMYILHLLQSMKQHFSEAFCQTVQCPVYTSTFFIQVHQGSRNYNIWQNSLWIDGCPCPIPKIIGHEDVGEGCRDWLLHQPIPFVWKRYCMRQHYFEEFLFQPRHHGPKNQWESRNLRGLGIGYKVEWTRLPKYFWLMLIVDSSRMLLHQSLIHSIWFNKMDVSKIEPKRNKFFYQRRNITYMMKSINK